jgi:hypothetical protein
MIILTWISNTIRKAYIFTYNLKIQLNLIENNTKSLYKKQ